MSLQKIKQIFSKLSSCTMWFLQLLNARAVHGEFVYNAHDIVVTTPNAIIEFTRELGLAYTKEKGRLSKYQMVCDYDGSTEGNKIYKIDFSDELISESGEKLIHAMANPDMRGNALDFSANTYVLKGNILIDEIQISVKLFTIISPFKVLKHTFMWDGDSFKVLPDKYLSLRGYVDVVMIDNTAYLFNMNGEKLFNLERAYKSICRNKVEDIIGSGIVSDESTFRQYATSGHNPGKFVSFDENRLRKIKDDAGFKNSIAGKFGIIQTPERIFDSSDSENVNRIVKFHCGFALYVLPLLAFDFTQWFDTVQFIIVFGFLAVLCLLHYRCDSNVCLELVGYRLYKCSLHSESDDKEGIIILIRRKQLNVNDEVVIRKLNDELYIGKYKVSEEQP